MADRVTFTPGSAERIAKVVRIVEAGNRDATGYVPSPRLQGGGGKLFRVCTFTGAWSIGSTKTVTFKNQTATPNTASATNLFFPLTNTATTTTRDCAIAKDGTAWYLIDVRFYEKTATLSGGSLSQSVVSSVQIAAELDTSTCAITVSQTPTTASVTVMSSTFTSTYLSLDP